MLTKTLSAEVKDLDKGMVKFQFSQFDFVDTDNDITRKGAFVRTIKENFNRIKHFKNHRMDQAPGVVKELYEDNEGAFAISQLILDSTLGKDTYAEYKAGAITEHSYGYEIERANQIEQEGKQVQELVELRLKEVSSLNAWGASEMTPTLDVKEMFKDKSEKDIMDYLDKLEQLKKGDFSDEYFEKLHNRIAVVTNFLDALCKSLDTLESSSTDGSLIDAMEHSMIFNRANHGRKGTENVYRKCRSKSKGSD